MPKMSNDLVDAIYGEGFFFEEAIDFEVGHGKIIYGDKELVMRGEFTGGNWMACMATHLTDEFYKEVVKTFGEDGDIVATLLQYIDTMFKDYYPSEEEILEENKIWNESCGKGNEETLSKTESRLIDLEYELFNDVYLTWK